MYTPFRCSCRGSRASSSRLIVLSVAPGPIRIFITHSSPRRSPSWKRLLVSHILHTAAILHSSSYYSIRSVLMVLYGDRCCCYRCCCCSRMILSLYSSSVSRMNQLRDPSFFFFSLPPFPPLFCSVFRAFSRHESFASSRTRDACSRKTRRRFDDVEIKTRRGDATRDARSIDHRARSRATLPKRRNRVNRYRAFGLPDQSAFRLPISLRESCLSRRLDSSLPRATFFIRAQSRRVFGHAR